MALKTTIARFLAASALCSALTCACASHDGQGAVLADSVAIEEGSESSPSSNIGGFNAEGISIQIDRCERDGDEWSTAGTAANTSSSGISGRFQISAVDTEFLAGYEAIGEVSFDLGPGDSLAWQASDVALIGEGDVLCHVGSFHIGQRLVSQAGILSDAARLKFHEGFYLPKNVDPATQCPPNAVISEAAGQEVVETESWVEPVDAWNRSGEAFGCRVNFESSFLIAGIGDPSLVPVGTRANVGLVRRSEIGNDVFELNDGSQCTVGSRSTGIVAQVNSFGDIANPCTTAEVLYLEIKKLGIG